MTAPTAKRATLQLDQLPRPWPFLSTDPRMTGDDSEPDEPSGPYCECNEAPTIEEADSGVCDACGKPLV